MPNGNKNETTAKKPAPAKGTLNSMNRAEQDWHVPFFIANCKTKAS
jgi:hypothetical protein